MTVAQLIDFLKTQPKDLDVAYRCCSEQVLLDAKDIKVTKCSVPRDDGWIHDYMSGRPSQEYLLFPGN